MQEEIERQTIAVSTTAVKITGRTLKKLLSALIKKLQQKAAEPHHGKQTVKQLAKQNAGMQNIEIANDNIKSFERVARKYGVDFALKRDKSQVPPRWLVFFKAKDTDALTAAFKEFTGKIPKQQDRPSLRETLRGFMEQIKNAVHDRERHKEQGGPEL